MNLRGDNQMKILGKEIKSIQRQKIDKDIEEKITNAIKRHSQIEATIEQNKIRDNVKGRAQVCGYSVKYLNQLSDSLKELDMYKKLMDRSDKAPVFEGEDLSLQWKEDAIETDKQDQVQRATMKVEPHDLSTLASLGQEIDLMPKLLTQIDEAKVLFRDNMTSSLNQMGYHNPFMPWLGAIKTYYHYLMIDNTVFDNKYYFVVTGIKEEMLLSEDNPFVNVSLNNTKYDGLNQSLQDFKNNIAKLFTNNSRTLRGTNNNIIAIDLTDLKTNKKIQALSALKQKKITANLVPNVILEYLCNKAYSFIKTFAKGSQRQPYDDRIKEDKQGLYKFMSKLFE